MESGWWVLIWQYHDEVAVNDFLCSFFIFLLSLGLSLFTAYHNGNSEFINDYGRSWLQKSSSNKLVVMVVRPCTSNNNRWVAVVTLSWYKAAGDDDFSRYHGARSGLLLMVMAVPHNANVIVMMPLNALKSDFIYPFSNSYLHCCSIVYKKILVAPHNNVKVMKF